MAKIVLTVQLQDNGNNPILTGTQTLPSFTSSDIQTALDFMKGNKMISLLRMMGWRADSTFTLVGEPVTLIINNLGGTP